MGKKIIIIWNQRIIFLWMWQEGNVSKFWNDMHRGRTIRADGKWILRTTPWILAWKMFGHGDLQVPWYLWATPCALCSYNQFGAVLQRKIQPPGCLAQCIWVKCSCTQWRLIWMVLSFSAFTVRNFRRAFLSWCPPDVLCYKPITLVQDDGSCSLLH